MKKIYKHKAFLKKLALIATESERMSKLKTYLFSLPPFEFEKFIKEQLHEIGISIDVLLENNSLTHKERADLATDIDDTILLIQAMKEDLMLTQLKAA